MRRLKDCQWADASGWPRSLQLALATFGILALELALIRWTSCQIRTFAYFSNLVLISSFLGMGLGVAVGRRYPGLVHFVLPVVLLVSLPLALSADLGLIHLTFADNALFLWDSAPSGGTFAHLWRFGLFIALLVAIVGVFVLTGVPVGHLFSRMPALRAYSADLTGSLLGIVAFTAATFFDAGPPVWLVLGCLPFVLLSRKPLTVVSFAGVILLGWYSVQGAIFSPYNRIDVEQQKTKKVVRVNRDFHQYIHNLSKAYILSTQHSPKERLRLRYQRFVYDIPFNVNARRGRALIVGAGTGNDVQAARRNGYKTIYSVEIDDQLLQLGRELHPERPYDDPRVVPVVNDARAFFQQHSGERFDVVCYGFLDSHALFSSMSSLRLDNYVYTEEGIRSAWRLVDAKGHMSVAFSVVAGEWIFERLYWTIYRATGKRPVALGHSMQMGVTFLVKRDDARLDLRRHSGVFRPAPRRAEEQVMTTTDDWPFLYLRPDHFPWKYTIVLTLLLIITVIMMPVAFGRGTISRSFDPCLFFMGAAFMLIETRGVTALSLLFGSTWLVNSSVFFGILVVVLCANLIVLRAGLQRPRPWFLLLFLSVALLWAVPPSSLSVLPLLVRGTIGGLINALPIGFAGVIVSIQLSRSGDPAASLGSNLLGSVLGGCLEYLSMLTGLRALVLLALAFYLMALLAIIRGKQPATGSTAQPPP